MRSVSLVSQDELRRTVPHSRPCAELESRKQVQHGTSSGHQQISCPSASYIPSGSLRQPVQQAAPRHLQLWLVRTREVPDARCVRSSSPGPEGMPLRVAKGTVQMNYVKAPERGRPGFPGAQCPHRGEARGSQRDDRATLLLEARNDRDGSPGASGRPGPARAWPAAP